MTELGIRPFNARSLVLSVLLGLPTAQLPTTAPARLAELFRISPGTMRTAISRMLAAGELVAVDGAYALHGPLLERKAAQDAGRHRPAGTGSDWDGTWWLVTAVAPARRPDERRSFRVAMANARLGELRPDTWLRPANLPGPVAGSGTIVVRGAIDGVDDTELAASLWDLDAVEARCAELLVAVDDGLAQLDGDPPAAIAGAIVLAAAVVRFLRADPLLPPALTPSGWSADEMRRRYTAFDRRLGRALAEVLASP